jgi:hypothetical protein
MLRQAQLIDTVLQYQRFLTGESTIDGLRKRILAIRNSEQREIDLQNIVDEKEWELRKRMIKAASEKFFDPCWAKYLGDYTPDQTKFEGYDLSTDVGVIKAVEKAIRDESVKGHAIGGLMLEVNTVPSISDGSVSPWEFTFQFTDLLNVIWYQAFQAVMRGVLLKNCRNEQCDKPQRLFVADRPNQVYCGTRCRNYHNVQAWRNRRRQLKSKGDLLP